MLGKPRGGKSSSISNSPQDKCTHLKRYSSFLMCSAYIGFLNLPARSSFIYIQMFCGQVNFSVLLAHLS